jgi:hypothetical protein
LLFLLINDALFFFSLRGVMKIAAMTRFSGRFSFFPLFPPFSPQRDFL